MRRDPHSYTDDTQPAVEHLDWRVRVDFAARTLDCTATLLLTTAAKGALDLDTRDLTIRAVSDGDGVALPFALAAPEPILGARLRVELVRPTQAVRIDYHSSPSASALQWLTPAQTAGGAHPFLFSQCQAIHARSVVPLQDTPRRRLRYRAELTVPGELRALMAAAAVGDHTAGGVTVSRWQMAQPIAPYLLAFAVGRLTAHELGPRSRVWAEPEVLARAAHEFAGVDAMLTTAERLFGPYDWERFDILTMPPSFPYGGMENPRLTFLTPTVLAGDRSLVNVLAHELAHSWTGNLVCNADAEHFWLNEGFTVFAERRIIEALEGEDARDLHAALGRRELDHELARFAARPELTRLHTQLGGVDPDEAFSVVPYEKGYLFLRALEETVGRAAFDAFLKRYVETFRFDAITTEDFCTLVERELPGALKKVDAPAWLDGPGLPANAPLARSARLAALGELGSAVPPAELTPTEWQIYLDALPRPADAAALRALDERHHLSARENAEVLVAWLRLRAESADRSALPALESLLGRVGRMKYLRPLYGALIADPETRPFAAACFARFRDGYHPIAQQVIEGLLAQP